MIAPGNTLRYGLAITDTSNLPQKPFRIRANLGDPQICRPDTSVSYRLPFLPGNTCKVLQGYHGEFSHNQGVSKHALDFNLHIGDTVCAARDGIVVGVIDGYEVGGSHPRYRPYANSINVYHADGTVGLYVHLQPGSAMVSVGDSVKLGQALATVGLTGITDGPHLHFCVGRL